VDRRRIAVIVEADAGAADFIDFRFLIAAPELAPEPAAVRVAEGALEREARIEADLGVDRADIEVGILDEADAGAPLQVEALGRKGRRGGELAR